MNIKAHYLTIVVLLCASHCTPPMNAISQDELHQVATKVSKHLLSSPKYMMYETDFLHAVHYAEVCAAYGAIRYAVLASDSVLLTQLADRYEQLRDDSIAWQDHHVDGNVYGILPFQLYQQTQDSLHLKHGLFMADQQWKNPLPSGLTHQTRYWIDDVFMVAALQVEAYKATNSSKYLDRAAQFCAHYIDSLQQENGLFFHGADAPIHWGRGNGWMAVGIAAVLSDLPKIHPQYPSIANAYIKMMSSLLDYQKTNGLWNQVIDMDSAWPESSCTAMFAYSMIVGINRGILPSDQYLPSVLAAWQALKSRVTEDGQLQDICAGTGQSKDVQYYLNRPKISGDFHGQAPLLWLIRELLLWKDMN